jgi:hypothetical protein
VYVCERDEIVEGLGTLELRLLSATISAGRVIWRMGLKYAQYVEEGECFPRVHERNITELRHLERWFKGVDSGPLGWQEEGTGIYQRGQRSVFVVGAHVGHGG